MATPAPTAETDRPAIGWRLVGLVPAPALFSVSAIFHYLGPALAVLLFSQVGVLGAAWLRIATAAAVFAVWRRPWRMFREPASGTPDSRRRLGRLRRRLVLQLGVVLALMNISFYLAIARLPLSTVGAIEFLGVIVLAALGVRSRRNLLALLLAVTGVAVLTDIRLADEPLGFLFAFVNLVLFIGYVVLGHRIANLRPPGAGRWSGIDQLGAAMLIAAVVVTPIGGGEAAAAFTHPGWLLAGVGVGVCSSVIPYVFDQLVMARLRRATFALMLSILPASATIVGMVVLAQKPTGQDLAGIALITIAIGMHQR